MLLGGKLSHDSPEEVVASGWQRARESFTEREAQYLGVGSWIGEEENNGLENSRLEKKQCEQAYTWYSLIVDVKNREQ